MQQTTTKRWQSFPISWWLLILVCLVAGLIFRSVNLDKVYWYDEAFTTLRISGYTEAEAVQDLTAQELVSPSAFQKYRQINPDKGLFETVQGLATEEPQHTPLYYVLARIWAGWFGDGIATIRGLSVLLSILAVPSMGWLCWELYQSQQAAWLGACLLAVSPFQIVYAQEARPTALWGVTILLSSAALLRALRVNSPITWLIYTLTLTLNLYAYLFSSLVAITHFIYVLAIERLRWSKITQRFILAFGISCVAFLPWIGALLLNSSQVETVTDWLTQENRFSLIEILKVWIYHFSLPFVDRGSQSLPLGLRLLFFVLQSAVRIAVVFGLYLLWRKTPWRVWLFVFLMIGVPAIALTVPDLLSGGKRSTIPRYLVPVYLGLELALTYLLSRYLTPAVAKMRWRQRFWQLLATLVIMAGLVSSSLIATSPAWWNKGNNSRFPEIAAQINQAEQPLVVSTADLGDLMALSYYLDPKVRLSLYPACFACKFNRDRIQHFELPTIPPEFKTVFLFNPRPAAAWLEELKQQTTYPIKTLSEVKSDWNTEYWLWQIETPK